MVAAGPEQAEAVAAPSLAPQASSSGFPVGVNIFVSATLGQGANPTGSIRFTLFGPADPGCAGGPLFSTTTAVSGNGYYQSAVFTTLLAGTYRWIAAYSGDANNAPAATACADSAAAVLVVKRTPVYSATASVTAGRTIIDTATLANGVGPAGPTGTISFQLFGPDNLTCSGSPVFSSTKAVSGNGTYTSDSFTPSAAGGYRWTSLYSGDANNNLGYTVCADPAQAVTVTPPPTTTTTTTRPPTTTTTTRPPTTTTTRPPTTTTTTVPPPSRSSTERFVDGAYRDVLARPPTAAEVSFWVDVFATGFSRDNMGAVLTTSTEFRRLVIDSYHRSFLGRAASPNELTALVDLVAQGWPLEYAATVVLGGDEFYAARGRDPGRYVDALFGVVALAPDPSGRAFWLDQLNSGLDRYSVALAFLTSSRAHQNVVTLAYSWFLHRPPDAAGFSFWTNQLDRGLRQEYVYAFFVGSGEYWTAATS